MLTRMNLREMCVHLHSPLWRKGKQKRQKKTGQKKVQTIIRSRARKQFVNSSRASNLHRIRKEADSEEICVF